MQNNIPQLAIALNRECNMQCFYCRPGGANLNCAETTLSREELHKILTVAYDLGYRTFRLTGGEPTLRADLGQIIEDIDALGPDVKILLTTNGLFIDKYLESLVKVKNINVFFSVDSVTNKYVGIPKSLNRVVYENIKLLKQNKIYCRVNMVVMRRNREAVSEMINFCLNHGLDLKIHDLYFCEEILDPELSAKEFWEKEFYPLTTYTPLLLNLAEEIKYFPGHGPYGIPMYSFHIGKIKIILKDSSVGTRYVDECADCRLFPCRHGLYVPQISADGYLYFANCVENKYRMKISEQPEENIRAGFNYLLKILESSSLQTEGTKYEVTEN